MLIRYSPAISGVTTRFGIGQEPATLGTALLLFGMGVGPLVYVSLLALLIFDPAAECGKYHFHMDEREFSI